MSWQVTGEQTIELPDTVDPDDEDAVRAYILDNWSGIPLPEGWYVEGSDVLDEGNPITISKN